MTLKPAIVTVLAVLTSLQAEPARGQQVRVMAAGGGDVVSIGGSSSHAFEPAINSEQLDRFARVLGLGDEQKEAAQALFEAFQSDFSAKSKIARDKNESLREEMRDGAGPSVFEDVRKQMEEFRAESSRLETEFLADLKGLLTSEQADRWPRVERMRTRQATGRFGFVSGESVDLISVIDGMELPAEARAPVAAVLDQYEIDLDRELQERNRVHDSSDARIREAVEKGGVEAMQTEIPKIFQEQRDAGIRVREVNRRYARQLAEALPEQYRAAFDEQFRRAFYPSIYRPTHLERALTAVEGFDDLSADQKPEITEIRESLDREMRALRSQMESATDEDDATAPTFTFPPSEHKPSRLEGLQEQRRQLLKSTMDRLKRVLTEDQKTRLPKRDREDEAGGVFFAAPFGG